ncbi:MAG: hypothetical protein HC896_17775 [Bacteroidales bacterium]|nr:hypothetical protein [Bacteroidales bacterium]
MNEINYGNLSLSFHFDARIGGIMYSQTKLLAAFAGTSTETLYNMREPFVVPNAVYEVGRDENGNPVYAENTKPLNQQNWLNTGTMVAWKWMDLVT